MSGGCEEVQPLLSAWVDDMLDSAERTRVDAHLQRCPLCEDEVESLRRVRDLLRNLPVRRVPADVPLPPAPLTAARRSAPAPALPPWSGGQRVAAGFAVAVGLVTGAAFALGGQPAPEERVVNVPVDLYVADHLVHTVGGPLSTPVVVDGRP